MNGCDQSRDFFGLEFQLAVELAVEAFDVGAIQVYGDLSVDECGLEQSHLIEALG